ncbi:hydroxyacid dehydrogenase [Nonomuraea wenchangensis]
MVTDAARRPSALLVMPCHLADHVYGSDERARLDRLVRWAGPDATAEQLSRRPALLADVELLITGWGGPRLDRTLLSHATRLRAVFYGGGSVRPIVTDEFWTAGIRIVSAAAANAVPVAEFTFAQVTLALKHAHRSERAVRRLARFPSEPAAPGTFGSTVGILSLGLIGRLVAQRLSTLDVQVLAVDPYVDAASAAALGVELVGIEELFRRADVISVHTPSLPETWGLITEELLASMREGATIINTARGAVLDEPALIRVLRRRQDVFAILDVTHPEPPEPSSPLYSLPNVVLTPHIAGSIGLERRRVGRLVVDEVGRFVAGRPLLHEVRAADAALRA